MLKNVSSLAIVGLDTAENGPSKVRQVTNRIDGVQRLRSFAQLGSSLSTQGLGRFGSVFSVSVLDFLHLGSSLSLRSFLRLGSSASVFGAARFALLLTNMDRTTQIFQLANIVGSITPQLHISVRTLNILFSLV